MGTPEIKLSKSLLYLQVSLLGRVELWLTYRDLKPASSITLRKPFDTTKRSTQRLIKWLADARIYYQIDIKKNDLLHISKNETLVNTMLKLHWSEAPEDIISRGYNYGFPPKAVDQFAIDPTKLMSTLNNPVLDEYYWKPYMRYKARIGHEYEDSIVAKNWADLVRKETPTLASWFEKEMNKLWL